MTHEKSVPPACCPAQSGSFDRRRFLGMTILAAGSGLALAGRPRPGGASGTAKALLLSCMDYRLIDDLVRFMDGQGLQNQYDHVILAGASLGVVSEGFSDWHLTFWQHLDVAIELHRIETVIVIDHRDCGAYRIALGGVPDASPDKEYEQHRNVMLEFAIQLRERHPALGLETYLMALDGSVEPVPLS